MDNNPFRQNSDMYSSPPIGQTNYLQPGFPQQNIMAQTTSTFTPSYNTQWQQPQQFFQTGSGYPTTNNQQPSLYQLQQQQYLQQRLQQQQQQQQQPLSVTQAQSSLYSMPQQQQQRPSYLVSQPQPNMLQHGVSYNPTGYYQFQQQQQQPFQQPQRMPMSMPPQSSNFYGGSMQQLPQQQQHDASNIYIPPDFGLSRNNTQTSSSTFTPKHPPVDASTLLKSGKVRKVECPVCHKMIEGDDPAINHHVNDHLEYDT